MEFKRFDLENMFEEIKELLNYVENNKLTDKQYMFFLTNNDTLKYKLTKESLPHLLGINTTYLLSTGLYSSKNSYYMTEEMLNDPFRLYKAASSGQISYDKLFSPHIKRKIKYFKQNLDIDIHDIDIICKYDKSRTYVTGEEAKKFNYIITKKYPDGKIGLLCLVFNEDVLSPISNQIFENENEAEETLKTLLEHQEITYISGIHESHFTILKSNLSFKEKIERLNSLKEYKYKYNSSIDVHRECDFLLKKLVNVRNQSYQSDELMEIMIESIKNGKIIDIDSESELYKLASAFNDYICGNASENDEAYMTYTEQTNELTRIRKELDELRKCKSELEIQINSLTTTNNELQTQVNKSQEKEKQILKILKPEN